MSTVKEINKKSIALGMKGKAWTKEVHEHAMTIIAHIKDHGDVSIATVLCDNMPKGTQSNALREWFIAYGGCSWNEVKKAFGKAKDFEFDFAAADAEPWYELAKEPEFKPVDSLALINAAVKKMQAAIDSGEVEKHKINPTHFEALKAIAEGADLKFED